MTISETGHLVLTTLHTNSASATINRIIDVFPPHQQDQVRVQLSGVLRGVMSQTLLPRAGNPGRVLACEVMVPNEAIQALIRDNKVHQIYSVMQSGQGKSGMLTFNQSLVSLLQRRLISWETAYMASMRKDELQHMVENAAGASGGS